MEVNKRRPIANFTSCGKGGPKT